MAKKKKILLLSDDLRMHSGIATMSREFVLGTVDKYDWVQLGAAIKHPDEGKIMDISEDVQKQTGVKDAYVKIYASSGYGNENVVREIMGYEKPDAILHYTDPRFWIWLYQMEHELRQNLPLMFYTIWDDMPFPRWNEPYYESCDQLMAISKQSYQIVKNVIRKNPKKKHQVTYIPHGINENQFFPITELSPQWDEFQKFKSQYLEGFEPKFTLLYNNRNIRRKMMGDVILAYKTFCDTLSKQEAKKCLLIMHTHVVDENGTDLPAVAKEICPDYKILFSANKMDTNQMNMMYNCADVCINLASNEGFGLGTCEALMSATPIIVNVTGGLQDQCGFKLKGKHMSEDDYEGINTLHDDRKWKDNPDLTHGEWVKPVWPSNRALVGSPPTPYIFDDRCRFDDAAEKIKEWYDETPERRKEYGELGREFVLREDVGMSAANMCKRFIKDMDTCMEKFEPRKRFTLYKV
tara:strand:+ start:380 stop:1774 length:1395 start_codon:yes stop_codon:yes gene_type:complete